MLSTPLGFVTLLEAVEMARQKLADKDRAIRMIAEGCESGKIIAGYRSAVDGGADDLDRRVWQLPHWRSFFDRGEIELVLPLLDEQWRPVRDGRTARCPREIFIRRDGLENFVAQLPGPKGQGGRKPLVHWPTVHAELERLMDYHGEFGADSPEWNAKARLIEALQKFCVEKFGIEPDKNTIEENIKAPLAQWRERRNRSPGN